MSENIGLECSCGEKGLNHNDCGGVLLNSSNKTDWFDNLHVPKFADGKPSHLKQCPCMELFNPRLTNKDVWMAEHYPHYLEHENNRLLSSARLMHFDLLALGGVPYQEMVDRFGNEKA
jgi:hypothetical protein